MAHETGYGRRVAGHDFELINMQAGMTAYRDQALLFAAPRGIRVMTDRDGQVLSLVGMSASPVAGTLRTAQGDLDFRVAANEQLDLRNGRLIRVRNPGLVLPAS